MTMLTAFASQPWVERLGWTLVHFLWQGFAIAAIYAAVRRALACAWGPNARYLLACMTLGILMVAPLVTWALLGATANPQNVPGIHDTPPSPVVRSYGTAALPGAVAVNDAASGQQEQFLSWVVLIWLAGAVVFWGRLTGGWLVAARLRSTKVRMAPPEWQDVLRRLGTRMGLSRPVRLLISALVESPMVIGWLRPVVLVPVGALGGMPADHLEALLLHELAHIRRHDYLVNMLQSAVEALLFYHPAVWWVSGHLRSEREMCCDDRAVSIGGDALVYARALAQLESFRPARVAALAANGGSLAARIARLAGVPRPAMRTGAGSGTLAIGILAAAAFAVYGQPEEHPHFEVASIKPVHPGVDPTQGPMGAGFRPGGRFTATNMSLILLIQFAYADHDAPHWLPLPATRIVGGPAWINKEFYDIEGKPESNTDPRHTWLMVQTLLADRFHLALHRETRELPVYDLTVAKSGPKLPPAAQAECISFPPGTPPRQVPGKVDCGYVSGPFGIANNGLRIQGRKVHVSDLARELSSTLDRPVLDRTGLANEFDLRLNFTSSAALLGVPGFGGRGDPGGPRPVADADMPDIFTALEEQYGLKLVAAKGPVEVLVIDHAERPAAN